MYGDVSPITWQLYTINKNHQTKKKKTRKKTQSLFIENSFPQRIFLQKG